MANESRVTMDASWRISWQGKQNKIPNPTTLPDVWLLRNTQDLEKKKVEKKTKKLMPPTTRTRTPVLSTAFAFPSRPAVLYIKPTHTKPGAFLNSERALLVLADSGFSCRWHSSGSGIALFLPRQLLFKDDDSSSPSPWMDALRSGLLAVSCHVQRLLCVPAAFYDPSAFRFLCFVTACR